MARKHGFKNDLPQGLIFKFDSQRVDKDPVTIANSALPLFRRSYPRRVFKRTVSLIFKGQYILVQSGEIGEGGMSVLSNMVLTEGEPLVVNFQIPGGSFVSLRAEIKSTVQQGASGGYVIHGIAFTEIEFAIKRQIRSFVSSRKF